MANKRHQEEPPPSPPPGDELRPLPCNLDSERMILGSILLNGERYQQVAGVIEADDFSLESHRRIFLRMQELQAAGDSIDRVTVANALMRIGQLQSVGGLTYLSSLDSGLPEIPNPDSYARIVKEKATLRKTIFAAQALISRCYDEGQDSAAILTQADADIQRLNAGSQLHAGLTPAQVIEAYPGGISAFLQPSLRPKGMQTGFFKLDDMTGGFHGGQLVVLAGRTSSGKSAFAMNITEKLLFEDKIPCDIFTFEMQDWEILNRMMSSRAKVSNYRIKHDFVGPAERRRMQEALSEIVDAPLLVSGKQVQDIHHICSQIERSVDKRGSRFVVIDHLGLLHSDGRSKDNRAQEISNWTRRLKLLAGKKNIVILLLCQLSRVPKQMLGKKHSLEDLKDSSSIEQDADMVMFTWREVLFRDAREDLKDKAEILIRKQRNGAIGEIPLKFFGDLTRFCNPDEEYVPDS